MLKVWFVRYPFLQAQLWKKYSNPRCDRRVTTRWSWPACFGAVSCATHCLLQGQVVSRYSNLIDLLTTSKCYLAAWLTFAAAFVATKVSILLLYLRIFPIQKLRYACAFLGSLVIGQGICIFTLGLCQCRPFRYIWDKAISGGVCLATTSVFYGSAITTLLLNTAILCVPLPIIWGLQMKKSYRLALTAVFSTGGL